MYGDVMGILWTTSRFGMISPLFRRFVQAGARGRGPLGAAERRQRLADRAACAARADAAAGLGDAGAGDAWRVAKKGVKHGVIIVHVNVNRC